MKRLLPVIIVAVALLRGYGITHVAQRSETIGSPTIRTVVRSAINQTRITTGYDAAYAQIAYPGGDVSPKQGACSDVIIRAFRSAGVDLQQLVHEDMGRNFRFYPHRWGLTHPDTNIDHRRVPNLMVFFERQHKNLAITADPTDYLPGDVVVWDMGGGRTHIGLVTGEIDSLSFRRFVVHNIGNGARIEDVLFSREVIGHYRYFI
jgi:uncharacterized protein